MHIRDGQITTNLANDVNNTQRELEESDLENWSYWTFEPGFETPGTLHFQNHSVYQPSFERIKKALDEAKTAVLGTWAAQSSSNVEEDLAMRVLQFFNAVDTPEAIVTRILDNPLYGSSSPQAYGVRMGVAQRILDARAARPGQQFQSVEQIDAVLGVGWDTLQDIFFAFAVESGAE